MRAVRRALMGEAAGAPARAVLLFALLTQGLLLLAAGLLLRLSGAFAVRELSPWPLAGVALAVQALAALLAARSPRGAARALVLAAGPVSTVAVAAVLLALGSGLGGALLLLGLALLLLGLCALLV